MIWVYIRPDGKREMWAMTALVQDWQEGTPFDAGGKLDLHVRWIRTQKKTHSAWIWFTLARRGSENCGWLHRRHACPTQQQWQSCFKNGNMRWLVTPMAILIGMFDGTEQKKRTCSAWFWFTLDRMGSEDFEWLHKRHAWLPPSLASVCNAACASRFPSSKCACVCHCSSCRCTFSFFSCDFHLILMKCCLSDRYFTWSTSCIGMWMNLWFVDLCSGQWPLALSAMKNLVMLTSWCDDDFLQGRGWSEPSIANEKCVHQHAFRLVCVWFFLMVGGHLTKWSALGEHY